MRLEVIDLAFKYGQNPVFSDVSFSLDAGEILFLLGPNGAGKTTLIKIILGIFKARRGQIRLDGEDITRWSRKKMACLIGYIPQQHDPPFPFSVLEAVIMGRTPHLSPFSVPSDKDAQIAHGALESLHIGHLANKRYTDVSGGERQLVLIARALAQKPKILVMDEPTANLDYGNQVNVLRHVRQLADEGLAVIISTHMPDYALRYASKTALMKDGGIMGYGRPDEIISGDSLKDIYGIDAELLEVFLGEDRRVKICVPR